MEGEGWEWEAEGEEGWDEEERRKGVLVLVCVCVCVWGGGGGGGGGGVPNRQAAVRTLVFARSFPVGSGSHHGRRTSALKDRDTKNENR